MTADPMQVRSPLEEEIRARRAAQAQRAERARLGEVDRRIAEEHQCRECGPSTQMARLYGPHPGFVGMTVAVPEYGGAEVVVYRPCFTCNPQRWRDWQEGNLRGTRRQDTKGPAAADRQQDCRSPQRSSPA